MQVSRRIATLNGTDWQLGQAPPDAAPDQPPWAELDRVHAWTPATVPGNVRTDLVRAGRLPDLFTGRAIEQAQWVDDHCWWLVRDFVLDSPPSFCAHLILRGVDYLSDTYLNGVHLGRHEGMFSPQCYNVSHLVQPSNRLAVRVVGSRWLPCNRSNLWERTLNRLEARFSNIGQRYPQRRDTLKCQMGFGWDFAPPLRTMGVWDDVYLVTSRNAFIADLASEYHDHQDTAALTVDLQIHATENQCADLLTSLAGETFSAEPLLDSRQIELSPGLNQIRYAIKIPQPQLWWPWDHGRPDLYRLSVELRDGEGVLDCATRTVGLRTVSIEDWTLQVNGRPIYARGANWVPADILPGRVTEADYHALLGLARGANMNLLRVWGGGLREKRSFYDLCDRLGILVWQEFPFSCAFLTRFPRSREYLQLVESEAGAIVRDLRQHPCLALWCGGNEFDPARNKPLVTTLKQVVDGLDPARPFLPASPANGDSHNWQVWHHFHPPTVYRQDKAGFASEFGLQAPPPLESLKRFIPPEDLWPPGPSWAAHGAGQEKLDRYARPFLDNSEASLIAYIQASQRAQAHGLQVAVEHYRRRRARGCGGVLVWQLNEPWPAISWSLVDRYRQPKPAYEVLKRLYAPVLVAVEYPLKRYSPGDELAGQVWVLNDSPTPLPGSQVVVSLEDTSGRLLNQFSEIADLPANAARPVGTFTWTLTAPDNWRLTCRLVRGDRTTGANEYNLAVYDGLQPSWKQHIWRWAQGWVMPS